MGALVVIPARMASTRFPGKPLVDLGGRPMLRHVLDRIDEAGLGLPVRVATPDEVIADACRAWGVAVTMTRADHPSGTDRIAEALADEPFDFAVNVQGDEPLLDPRSIRVLHDGMATSEAQVGTLWIPTEPHEEEDPAVVKLVTGDDGRAIYFSRYSIPYPRNARTDGLKRHLGLYAYRPEALRRFAERPPGPLETAESLEQLRFLEMGLDVRAWRGYPTGTAVDTPEQADEVRRALARRQA